MKALEIFIPTFLVILVVNQALYGGCFAGYCLAAAFPKVTLLSVAVSGLIYWVSKKEEKS